MNIYTTKFKVFIVLLLAVAVGTFWYIKNIVTSQPSTDINSASGITISDTKITTGLDESTDQLKSVFPSIYNLAIPFTPQAPTANWDELHNEACEETAAIMAEAYLSGDTRKKIPAVEVEAQITKLTEWQQKTFGYFLDTTAVETAQMISSVYGLKTELVQNFTEEDVHKAIFAKSVPIILVDGRKIGNPNYKQPGPIYHMLVIRGYKGDRLVTNDSGTRNGENYSYLYTTLRNATVDWDHATGTIDNTKSVMIVVSK